MASIKLYIRDNLQDTGMGHEGPVSASPDIIMRQLPQNDPQGSWGERSNYRNNQYLSQPVREVKDHFGYVRVLNRGTDSADRAEIKLYWANSAMLLRPRLWQSIGTTYRNILPANYLCVSPLIRWDRLRVPPPGHYCFIATVSHPDDPLINLSALPPIADFSAFIREEPKISWRNFDVIDVRRLDNPEFPIRFAIETGSGGGSGDWEDVSFEVTSNLPEGSTIDLQAPDTLRYALPTMPGSEPGTVRVSLSPNGQTSPFYRQPIPVGTMASMHFWVPQEHWQNGPYTVEFAQRYQGNRVGDLTWVLGIPEDLVPEDPAS